MGAGFTLIEVMVVVGIMAIVAMLAMPTLTGAFRRSALRAQGRALYAAFLQAQGAAAAEGVPHCLALDRGAKTWSVRANTNDDGKCDASDGGVTSHGGSGADGWPEHVAFGPTTGISSSLPVPYNHVASNAWCTECGVTHSTGAVFFAIDGRIVNGRHEVIASGAVMLHDETGQSDGLVQVVVFLGPTGDVRLFSAKE